jgi:hypothetical protein
MLKKAFPPVIKHPSKPGIGKMPTKADIRHTSTIRRLVHTFQSFQEKNSEHTRGGEEEKIEAAHNDSHSPVSLPHRPGPETEDSFRNTRHTQHVYDCSRWLIGDS